MISSTHRAEGFPQTPNLAMSQGLGSPVLDERAKSQNIILKTFQKDSV